MIQKNYLWIALLILLGMKQILAIPTNEQEQNFSTVRLFELSFSKDISAQEQKLFFAVLDNDYKAVEVLLKEKTNPNIRDTNGNTPLHYAPSLALVKLLVASGANVNAQNNNGVARSHIDVIYGRVSFVKFLLNNGASATLTTNNGVSLLHLATAISYYENPQILKRVANILKKGATIGATVGAGAGLGIGATLSAMGGEILIGETLAATGAGIVAGGAAGVAIAGVVIVFSAGTLAWIDIIIRNRIVGLLLAEGANPNAQDIDGNTPLHTLAGGKLLAAGNRRGGVIMAEKLIFNGAKRDIKNNVNQTPYDVAKEYNRKLLMPVLQLTRSRPLEKAAAWRPFKKDTINVLKEDTLNQ